METQSASVSQMGLGPTITHCGVQLSLHRTAQRPPHAPQLPPTVAAVHPGGSVVVVVPGQDDGVHGQPDVQHAWPLPSEKQAPPPEQSASDEHGDGPGLVWQLLVSTHSRALSG